MKSKYGLIGFFLGIGVVAVIAAALSSSNFNINQFISNGSNQPIMSLKNGVIVTNPVVGSGTLTGDVAGATNANGSTLFGSGTIPTARLGSGTATAVTALFGDNSWKIMSGTGNLIAEGTNGITVVTNGQLTTISFNGLNIVISNASFLGPFTGSGTAAGKVTLNSGTGTGGIFDYSGATASNDVVAVDANGRFVSGGSAGLSQLWGTNTTTGSITNRNGGGVAVGNGAPTVAGQIALNSGTGTGGYFDYSGATHSNEMVLTSSAGRFTSLADGGANTFLQGTTPPTYTTVANAALANSSLTVNGTSGHVTTTSATIALGGSATLDVGTSVALRDANNAFTTGSSNYFAPNVTTSTNQNQVTPDFSVAEQLMSTNAAFTFLAPVGVDSGKVEAQWTLVNVTNTTSSAVLITSPANCHTVGTAYCTNLTAVWFQCYANKFTNAYYVPIF